MALQSLVWIMQAYGIEGGSFWRWVDFSNSEELDPALQMPVKKRGPDFTYNPVKAVLEELYTRGQANDLSLTPDQTPPVFASVVSAPASIQNGEPFVITASLGETHLFVTADISGLDPHQTDPVFFNQVGDGDYEAEITLNRWNSTPNGAKAIPIQAMDFWSNTASTSLSVVLDNPPPALDAAPPNDDFSGQTLDTRKWSAGGSGGGAVSQDGKLIFSTSGKETFSSAGVTSNWNFPGDFDVQVDFQLGEGWGSPAREHVDGAFFSATIAGQEYRITRLRSHNDDSMFSWSTTGALNAAVSTNALDGKYRLVRAKTTLTLLYDIGDGWQELASTPVPADPAQINLGNGSINASMAFTTYFAHFRINSGLTTYQL
jgi:hypothetical protein